MVAQTVGGPPIDTILIGGGYYGVLIRALLAVLHQRASRDEVGALYFDTLAYGYCLLDAAGHRVEPTYPEGAAVRIAFASTDEPDRG